jgi:abequosyltransferase
MNDVRLSFCIPTYNFGEFIGETLESIITQAGDDVEIVVGDGASTDNTEEVVRGYQSSFPKLFYYRFDKKGGIDLDLTKTVELSSGDYCWLMSSDDVLKPGAIQRLLNEIKLGQDIYLCNRTVCDRNLRPKRYSKLWLTNRIKDRVFYFSNKSDQLDYLNASQSIGALFSYVSSIIVRRNKWNEIGYDERLARSNYAHVFRLLSILQLSGNSLKYIKEQLVLFRGYNDSFRDKGYANRILIDLDGYRYLGECLFPDKEVRNAFKAVMRREHKCYFLPRLKSEVDDELKWNELEKSLSYYGYSSAEMLLINMLGASKIFVRMARSLKRLLRV